MPTLRILPDIWKFNVNFTITEKVNLVPALTML